MFFFFKAGKTNYGVNVLVGNVFMLFFTFYFFKFFPDCRLQIVCVN